MQTRCKHSLCVKAGIALNLNFLTAIKEKLPTTTVHNPKAGCLSSLWILENCYSSPGRQSLLQHT